MGSAPAESEDNLAGPPKHYFFNFYINRSDANTSDVV